MNMNLKFIKFLTDNNIFTVGNLVRRNGIFKTLSDIVSSNTKLGLYNQHCFYGYLLHLLLQQNG